MIFYHLIFALMFALLFSAIFSGAFRKKGPWTNLLFSFILVFLATWAAGIWLVPVGKPIFGVYWVPFFFAGLVVTLLLAAAMPSTREKSTVEIIDPEKEKAKGKAVSTAWGVFFWLLVIALAILIAVRYIWNDPVMTSAAILG